MLEQIVISTILAIVAGTLIMYGLLLVLRNKAKFLNIFILNVLVDIAGGVLEIYLEPLLTRGVCIIIAMLLLKQFSDIRNWGVVLIVAAIGNVCAALAAVGLMEVAVIPLLNKL